jgi:hypothetical protein
LYQPIFGYLGTKSECCSNSDDRKLEIGSTGMGVVEVHHHLVHVVLVCGRIQGFNQTTGSEHTEFIFSLKNTAAVTLLG